MNTKTMTDRAMSVIDQYLHFRVGSAITAVPYFNNKTTRLKLALRVNSGKGSPKEIFEEVQSLAVKNHISMPDLTSDILKKLLVDNNIGIDCSGFAYYILNAESVERYKKTLDRQLTFINCTGFIGKIRCALRPVQNADVSTLDHDLNSQHVEVQDVLPGDMITFMGTNVSGGAQRDHVAVIHQVDYQNYIPTKIHYSHACSYPEDGLYGNGVRQGSIEIHDPKKPIIEGRWNETKLFEKTKNSKTEIRRLKWF